MKTQLAVTALLTMLLCSACADQTCSTSDAVTLHDGTDVYDALSVHDGFLYLEVPGEGVQRCSTHGCPATTTIIDSPAFVSSALAGGITYTTQIAAPDGSVTGELRAVNGDGTSDRSVASALSYPAFVAVAGGQTFWAQDSFAFDDTPATIHCIGCGGTDPSTPWIGGLGGGTYGLMVDASNVYVLADDASLQSVTLYACSLQTPCPSGGRVVLGQLDRTVGTQQIASDGTYVYVARAGQGDVVRVDRNGQVSTVVDEPNVTAIAIDGGTLYFGTSSGGVERVAADGSAAPISIACGTGMIAALAVDDTSAYFITGSSGSTLQKTPK